VNQSFVVQESIMIIDWIWLGKTFWGKNVYLTLKRNEKNMETSCILLIVMEND